MKSLLLALMSGIAFQSFTVHAKTEVFKIKPFVTEPSSAAEIQSGLLNLYRNNPDKLNLSLQTSKSFGFQNFVYKKLNDRLAKDNSISVTSEERRLTGNFVKETKLTFESLIQRPGNHASNKVVAKIYEPSVIPRFCDYKFPTSIILHHILNEVNIIEDLSKVMSSGVLSKSSVMVVIQMPHYAERRNGDEEFLNSDLESFKLNMAQLILDVHVLKNIIENLPRVDANNISLSGLSLGSVMGLTVGAFDQSFHGYGFLVGGTDLANILMNRVRNRTDSEVAIAMANVEKDENKIRDTLAEVDGATWLHRYRNKNMFFVSATQDDIVDINTSVLPMLAELKEQNNQVQQKINDDKHSPTGSIFKKLNNVFLPLQDFITQEGKQLNEVCPANQSF